MSLVSIVVSQLLAGAPANLQQQGAFISQGGTTLPANTYQRLTQKSDLTALLAAPLAIANLVWAGGVVTATTSAPIPGLSVGDTFVTSLAGQVPAGYIGTYKATVTGASTFTVPLAINPGAETTPGTYTPPSQAELLSMANSFYGQSGTTPVFVLELGAGDGNTGPTALGNFITASPKFFYSYLVPRSWDVTANYLALLAAYSAPNALTYFFTTSTVGTWAQYPATSKAGIVGIESPTITLQEFSMAAPFNVALSYNPSANELMTSFNNSFLYGVTAYPTQNNQSLLTTLATGNITVVGTAAEGGLSTETIGNSSFGPGGHTLDGQDFSYWFEVDWLQLNMHLNLANYIINNTANNPINPLGLDQESINRMQDNVVGTLTSASAFNIIEGQIVATKLTPTALGVALDDGVYENSDVVNAVPFNAYYTLNPNDYGARKYNGISVIAIPQSFPEAVQITLQVTNLISL